MAEILISRPKQLLLDELYASGDNHEKIDFE